MRIVLDTFHMLQRVVRSVKSGDLKQGKNKGKRVLFFRKLRMLLRQENDQGKFRTQATPSAEEIEKNVNALLLEFGPFLRKKTIIELKKMKTKHLQCLESVPCHVGTQKNEGLKICDLNAKKIISLDGICALHFCPCLSGFSC